MKFSKLHFKSSGYRTDTGIDPPVVSPPVNSVLPVITGTLTVGNELTLGNGTWTNSPTSFGYQWKKNGADIVGATSNKYTTVVGDAGANITGVVTAGNSGGSNSATSAAVVPTSGSSVGAFKLANAVSYLLLAAGGKLLTN